MKTLRTAHKKSAKQTEAIKRKDQWLKFFKIKFKSPSPSSLSSEPNLQPVELLEDFNDEMYFYSCFVTAEIIEIDPENEKVYSQNLIQVDFALTSLMLTYKIARW